MGFGMVKMPAFATSELNRVYRITPYFCARLSDGQRQMKE